jgi:hypothetical protein
VTVKVVGKMYSVVNEEMIGLVRLADEVVFEERRKRHPDAAQLKDGCGSPSAEQPPLAAGAVVGNDIHKRHPQARRVPLSFQLINEAHQLEVICAMWIES